MGKFVKQKENAKKKTSSGVKVSPTFGGVAKPRKNSKKPVVKLTNSSTENSKQFCGTSGGALFKLKSDLGQHLLKSTAVANSIIEKADVKPSDHILEIGPGTGILTIPLLQKCASLTAIELDPRMAAELTKRVQCLPREISRKLRLIIGDAIKQSSLPYCDLLIANTPYQISSPLVFKFLAMDPSPRAAVLMFQHEFALRLVAPPDSPNYSRLSANVALWASTNMLMKVSRSNFRPPPKVESSVVRITPKKPRPAVDFAEWDGLLRILFIRKNRTVRSIFQSTSILSQIARNWRLNNAINNSSLNSHLNSATNNTVYCQSNLNLSREEQILLMQKYIGGVSDDKLDDEWNGFSEREDCEDHSDSNSVMLDDFAPHHSFNPVTKRQTSDPDIEIVQPIINRILNQETNYAQRRVKSLHQADLLHLLWSFNCNGIRFS